MTVNGDKQPVIVFVHGAWGSSRSWRQVRDILEGSGFTTGALDLPSVYRDDAAVLGDMHDDARAIRRFVDGIDAPIVLVAHSYGGVPATEALSGATNVIHVIYVAAFMLDQGQSLLAAVGGKEPSVWRTSEDGRLVELVDPEHVIYPDCDPQVAAAAAAELRPHARVAFTQELNSAGWHDIPTTYIVSDNDVAIPPQVQETMAQRAGHVEHLPSAHTPFISRPQDLADKILQIIKSSIRS